MNLKSISLSVYVRCAIVSFVFFIIVFLLSCKKETPVEQSSNVPEKLILSVTDTSATGNYILRWIHSSRATSYALQEDIDPPFNNAITVYLGTDTTYRITGKPFGKTFFYRVRGNNSIGSGEWSETRQVVTYQKPAPKIVVSTSNLNFGDVFVDSTKVLNLWIGNNGNDTLQITNVRFWSGAYHLNSTLPLKIAPSGYGYLPINFHPLVGGTYTDTLIIESNDIDNYPPKIYLSGNSRIPSPPQLFVNPATLSFSVYTLIGKESLTLTLKNIGESALHIQSIVPSSSRLSILGDTSYEILSKDSVNLTILYTSTTDGRDTGNITIINNDPNNENYKVPFNALIFREAVFAGTGHGVYYFPANGTNWKVVNTGLIINTVWSLASSDSNIFAGTYEGKVFRSGNNGESWQTVKTGVDFRSLAVSGSNIFAGDYGKIFVSTDNGTNWQITYYLGVAASVTCFAVGGSHIFAGTGNGIFYSNDNGTSWGRTNMVYTVLSLAISDSNIFAGTYGTGIFLSTDNGANWKTVNTGLTNANVNCLAIGGSHIFAGTDGGVFLSTNDGTSWTHLNNGLPSSIVYSFAISDSNIFAGFAMSNGVFTSADSGMSWTQINNGLTNNALSMIVRKSH